MPIILKVVLFLEISAILPTPVLVLYRDASFVPYVAAYQMASFICLCFLGLYLVRKGV